ncbi:hypothetical protein BG015_002325 [Linnemannia schmuckeri]|uniref:FAD-binding domain-containing protein n=1 Tax=Linnemannia schmuckeri TaxID=64567 RepID=A0A9P5RNP8_9FUNG|nr:hypothetical protein BG015_002325 [Linnemannia schmuckeri]
MTTADKPTVLIVGAGLCGLMLGTLLERIDVPYVIFERTSTIKSLGSAISVGCPVLALFQQLGIYEELVSVGFRTGYSQYIVSRPALYDLLLKQIPAHKVLLKKRILTILEEDDRATIQAADNTVYEGDLLVGADGAYSAVRQRLYEKLKVKGLLPKVDDEELPFNCTCLVGQTEPLDIEEFPILKNSFSQFLIVRGIDIPYMMCDETRHLQTSVKVGDKYLTVGDFYDRTPQELVSKVMLEEKVFETWYHGRTVLLGDGW